MPIYTYDQVFDACFEYFHGDEMAAKSCMTKYLLKDKDGNWLERTPNDYLAYRIANEFHRIEKSYLNPLSLEEIRDALGGISNEVLEKNPEMKKLLGHGPVVCQGSPTFGIGNNEKIISLSNCFVLSSPLDSYGSICMKDQEIAQVEKRRGGVGLCLDNLRPRGTVVKNSANTSDGISVFMERFSNTTKEVAQCIAGDQLVLTKNGLKEIKDVVIGDYAWTKVGWIKVINKTSNEKSVVFTKTKMGFSIKSSLDHVFLKIENGEFKETKLSSFSVGDEIVMIPGSETDFGLIQNVVDGVYFPKKCASTYRDIVLPPYLDEDLSYILGYSYGDGHFSYDKNHCQEKESLFLTCSNDSSGTKIIEKLVNKIKVVFGYEASVCKGSGKCCRVSIHSKKICGFLTANGLDKQKSNVIDVPDNVMMSNSSVQMAFFSGYFDADGCAHKYGKNIRASTTSKKFAEKIQLILMANGIVCNVQKRLPSGNRMVEYRINVSGSYSQNTLIGKSTSIKLNLMKRCSLTDKVMSPFKEGISECFVHKKLSNKYKYCPWNRYISTNTLYRLKKDGEYQNEMLVKDCIESIEDCGIVKTYDLQLEKENLFWCQGFYVHNSGRRGALLECLDCRHPEILTFINIKRDLKKVTGANISVKWHDDFFEALQKNGKYVLRFPVDVDPEKAQIVKEVNAKEIWDAFIDSTWSTAEPGCFYWDKMIGQSISDCYTSDSFRTICTNPCGELGLAGYNSCLLMLLNLLKFVKNPYYPDSSFDWESFEKYSKIGTRLIDDLVDLEIEKVKAIISKIENDPEPEDVKSIELNLWKNILKMSEKGRKTGLGVTGLGDMLAALNIKYSSQEAIDFCDKLFAKMQEYVYIESSILAKERGPFPCWSWEKEKDNYYIKKLPVEVQNMIEKYGRRNIANLTLSPAGTTSIMTQTTSGIEPLYMHEMTRRRKMTQDEEKNGVNPDSIDNDGIKWIHTKIFHKGYSDWQRVTGKDCFCESPYAGSQAYELDPMFRVKLQGKIQAHIDSSISSTINLSKSTTKEQVSEIYLAGWKAGLKGLTIYRDGSRDGVLISSSPQRPVKITESQAPSRPEILPCEIHVSNIKGNKWVFFVGLLGGVPYEIFGGKLETIDIPRKFIKGQEEVDAIIKKNSKNSIGISPYDLILGPKTASPFEFKDIASIFSPDSGSPTRLISMLLRHGVAISDICEQIRKIPQEDSMLTFEKGLSRVLRKYVADKTTAKGTCPECKSKLIYEGGCVKCSSCSWSRCD